MLWNITEQKVHSTISIIKAVRIGRLGSWRVDWIVLIVNPAAAKRANNGMPIIQLNMFGAIPYQKILGFF